MGDYFTATPTPTPKQGSPASMIDGAGQPIGEYLVTANQPPTRDLWRTIFLGYKLLDVWEVSLDHFLIRLVPDPGLAAVRSMAWASNKIDKVEKYKRFIPFSSI